ncbi:hypothetical protein ERJ75_001651400 [Trypanosoma vivax]|uniref:Uncharacterized protein n=1 Tax=Trypanosoma vivax (strain Y486) TaxID=1055687 RepID=G0U9K5_TRYVY|nr:hypothetical protein TRVL_06530 [Trypanosoma vivax]KAH8604940.1 hypothetical protein ERJ75_001651400 [Trypanosoma vivax]CCC54291.1 conserved hypothetical protein [Trypanosoma vivax Y486]
MGSNVADRSGTGGGGVRELGTVTAGMAMMNFDEKTKPYTRADLLEFIQNYEKNLNPEELLLVKKGMFFTFVGMPLAFIVGYKVASRLAWHRISRALGSPKGKENVAKTPWVVRNIQKVGQTIFGLGAATLPYVFAQQWFISRVLEMDEHQSDLSFHLRRLMITQRSSMMFTRTATREVTREEQQRLTDEAIAQEEENRSGRRGGAAAGATDINLRLGQQAMTPVAQAGYKPLPGQSS